MERPIGQEGRREGGRVGNAPVPFCSPRVRTAGAGIDGMACVVIFVTLDSPPLSSLLTYKLTHLVVDMF